jgi:hypothetical protein
VGTLQDVTTIAKHAGTLVSDRGTDVTIEITVEQPGLTLEFDEPDEFAKLITPADLRRVRAVSVWVSQNDAKINDPLNVSLTFEPSSWSDSAVYLRVAGPDRTDVEGLRTRLVERLDAGRRFPFVRGGAIAGGIAAFLAILTLALLMAGPLYDWTPRRVKDMESALGGLVVAGAISLVIAILSVPWMLLFPKWEWLGDDSRTRWAKWRRRVWAAAGVVATAVVGWAVVEVLG